MPAIIGMFYEHPVTSEPGYWVQLSYIPHLGESVIGMSQTEVGDLKLTGNTASRINQLQAAMMNTLLFGSETWDSTAGWTQDEIDDYINNPRPFTRIESGYCKRWPCEFDVQVLDIVARTLQISVMDGASTHVGYWG